MMMGYEPMQVVPAVLLSELFTGLLAGLAHHNVGNADFRPKSVRPGLIIRKIRELGLLASFNKGMSGGGYGPVVTGGQILSGVEGKNAVAITSLAEGLTCVVGFGAYLLTRSIQDWTLFPFLCIGAILSVPLSVCTVKRLNTRYLKLAIGVLTTALGVFTLAKILL